MHYQEGWTDGRKESLEEPQGLIQREHSLRRSSGTLGGSLCSLPAHSWKRSHTAAVGVWQFLLPSIQLSPLELAGLQHAPDTLLGSQVMLLPFLKSHGQSSLVQVLPCFHVCSGDSLHPPHRELHYICHQLVVLLLLFLVKRDGGWLKVWEKSHLPESK